MVSWLLHFGHELHLFFFLNEQEDSSNKTITTETIWQIRNLINQR